MSYHIKNFRQFVNESFGADTDLRRDLRKELVGSKGHKAQYDTLSPWERKELENLFAKLKSDDESALRAFVKSLSRYNSMAEIKSALREISDFLDKEPHVIQKRQRQREEEAEELKGYGWNDDDIDLVRQLGL